LTLALLGGWRLLLVLLLLLIVHELDLRRYGVLQGNLHLNPVQTEFQ
jgi:hypothetical protein